MKNKKQGILLPSIKVLNLWALPTHVLRLTRFLYLEFVLELRTPNLLLCCRFPFENEITCKPSIMMQFRQMSLSATSSSQVYRSFFLGLFRILLYCNYFNSSILTSKWGGIFIFPGKENEKDDSSSCVNSNYLSQLT